MSFFNYTNSITIQIVLSEIEWKPVSEVYENSIKIYLGFMKGVSGRIGHMHMYEWMRLA